MLVAFGCGGSDPPRRAAAPITAPTAGRPDLGSVDDEPTGSGPLVAILGDSLTTSSRDLLVADLHDRSVLIGAMFGEGWADGPFSDKLDADPPLIVDAALRYAAQRPAVMVLALGTNDAWNPSLPVDDALRQVDRALEAIENGTCVVVVEVDESVPEQANYDGERAARINDRLATRAEVTVPWSELTDLHRRWLADDGIHLRAAGRRARSTLIADAVASCLDSRDR